MGLVEKKKLPYPKSVFFIVSNEFCERFSYYGMRTILSLYLVDILLYSKNEAKVVYHGFTMMVYFFPIFGAMLADSYLGKFRTILYLSCIYATGNIVLSFGASSPISFPSKETSLLGLSLIAIGTGGIKPCVAAFGGDQFVLPQQEQQLDKFFALFYFAINAGSLISTAITPILREDVHCFGEDSCYPLAFSVPGILMIASIIIFVFGKSQYRIKEPEGNMLIKVSKCIANAISLKFKHSSSKGHWLDHSEEKYGSKLVNDIKILLKVLVLFIPVPFFWALYDQQGTAWTFQARTMNGNIGFYTILPDQMQVVNPLLILAFIPIFQYAIYPTLNKCHLLNKPLQKLVAGGLLAAVAFAISACVSLALESSQPVLPSKGIGQIRIYNGLNCDIRIPPIEGYPEEIRINKFDYYKMIDLKVIDNATFEYDSFDCIGDTDRKGIGGQFNVYEKKSVVYFFHNLDENPVEMLDNVDKHPKGYPNIRTLVASTQTVNLTYSIHSDIKLKINSSDTSIHDLIPGSYQLKIGDNATTNLKFSLGGVYTILATDSGIQNLFEITPPNSVHMLWLIPQYIIITMSEILFSITGLEFSYSQAPSSMKSVLQACWLLTTAVGNFCIVIIEAINYFDKQSSTFFLYAVLMVLDIGVFAILAMRYDYVEKEENSSVEDMECPQNGIENNAFKINDDNHTAKL